MIKSAGSIRGISRFGVITRVMIKHGFRDIVERFGEKSPSATADMKGGNASVSLEFPSPVRVRHVLEELGPSFIKLGQLLATRADVFPPEYIEEFRKLQDRVAPEPFDAVKKIIETELARPVASVFEQFDTRSIAAASVAQVHTARLTGGQSVAVKVIRPGIAKKIREDIQVMYYFSRKIERLFEVGKILGVVNLVREFERTVFRELDMYIEAGSIEKFSVAYGRHDEVHIPAVYWEYTTRSVLVMEYIPGVKVDQVDAIIDQGIDPKEIALIGLQSFSRQLMEFGFFHADPHPGNTIVMPDGRVGLVDFGIIGYLDEEMMQQVAYIFLGYAEHDYDMVMDALLASGIINEESMDIRRFRTDLKDTSEPFYGRSLLTISVKDVYDQIMQLVLKYRITLPRNLLLLLKTLIQTESLGKILGSDAGILVVIKPYAQKLLQRSFERDRILKSMVKDARLSHSYLKAAPKFIHDILKQLSKGRQSLEIRHGSTRRFENKLEKSVNRLTVGLIISASTIAAALILNSSQRFMEFTIDFFGLQIVSVTEILGITGYVVATILGIWLILSIFWSGRL